MKKFDFRWLPYGAAGVQAMLFAIAGDRYFGFWAGWVAGLGVGAVVSLSLAVASSRVSDIAQKRKGLAYLALAVLVCLSPATIALSFFMPSSVFTAIAWAVDVDIAIVLAGSIAGKSFIAGDQPAPSQTKPARKPKEVATEPEEPAFVCSCGKSFGSQSALNAHQRSHKEIIGYQASFEPITNDRSQKEK